MASRHDVVSNPFTAKFIRLKAAKLCRRADFSRSDREDIEQGMYGYLLEKAHLYDPKRGNVEAFVTHLVTTWIRMELRFRGRSRRIGRITTISIERTVVELDGDTQSLTGVLAHADQERRTGRHLPCPIEHLEIADAVRHAFAQLGSDEQRLLRFVSEHGVAAAAREWSRRNGRTVSRTWIEVRVRRMRARFEDAGLGDD
ncbi:MAG: hypothetical protein JNL80_15720 [Phycisphaerae bacterium]|nr:hypothetical protein [Phycisphaerae bacterium]